MRLAGRGTTGSIRYPLAERFADWYHGLRDGRAGIPDRTMATRYITTGHREMLIRLGQELFEHERLRFERARLDVPERIAGATARLDQLRAHRAEAERQLGDTDRPLSPQAEKWRRIGDMERPDQVVVQRRRTEQQRRISAARLTLNSVIAEIGRVEAELAAARRTDQRELQVATTRVLRVHEYIHRRLDCYLRSLVRAHPEGAWAGAQLVVPSFLPGWIGLEPSPAPDRGRHGKLPARHDQDADEAAPEPARVIRLNHPVTGFGSAQDEPPNVRIDAPGTGPLHFTLTLVGTDRLRLRDFGYGHGPYRYGQPVKSELLAAGDHFDFAGRRYYVRDGCNELEDAPIGKVNLIVSQVRAKSTRSFGWFGQQQQSKVLLTDMSFVQYAGTVLAVLGPSGAGKSSLINALIGDLPTESGSMFLGPLDLRVRSEQISDKLGYVPQDIDLHASLTVRQLLRYAYDLRYPARARRDARIKETCQELKLDNQLDQLVSTLSGGQRRRASIAMELLGKPPLLVLDEPTSGLDPGMDRAIMGHLRDYAGQGNTVIVSTHATAHLRDAGNAAVTEVLVVADYGRPVFLGWPNRVRQRLGVTSYAELMDKLTPDAGNRTNAWTDARAAEYQGGQEAEEARTAAAGHAPARQSPGGHRRSVLIVRRQLWTLLKRQATLLKVRGRRHGTSLVLWPLVVALLPLIVVGIAALLAALITPASGLGATRGAAGSIALSVLTTLAVLSGQALTYGDLVSDFPIIRREHRTGALLSMVMLSKWLVYSAVAVIQAAVMTLAFEVLRPGPAYANVLPPSVELFADLAALSIASLSLGLLISALTNKLEQAVALVTLTSITQIAFNGVTAQLSRGLNVVAVLLPDRWGLAAAASSVNLRRILEPPRQPADALWRHTTGQWTIDLIALAAQAAFFTVLATLVLGRRLRPRQPRRQRRTNLARPT
jgi:ABC-type multidrug transport system ATPase subunit